MSTLIPRLISYLENLGNGVTEPEYPRVGICYQLEKGFNWEIPKIIKDDYMQFIGYSGEPVTPINHIEGSWAAFIRLNKTGNMWTVLETDSEEDATYKQDRRRFCLWLATKIEEYYG